MLQTPPSDIGTQLAPTCYLCGANGVPLYQDLPDRLFGVAGTWNLKRCSNPRCRLIWLDPLPREDEISKAYLSYYTHAAPSSRTEAEAFPIWESRPMRSAGRIYLRGRFGYGQGVPTQRERFGYPFAALLFALLPGGLDRIEASVGSLAAPRPGERLLEVGCGNGGQLARMRELGWDVVGIDTDPLAIRATRARGLDARLGAETHAFPDESIDAIYSSHVLEHVHRPLELLKECHRVLKPGGVASMVTPNTASWGHQRFRSDWLGLDPPRHLMLFSPDTLRTLALEAGFRFSQVRTTARYAFIICGGSVLLERRTTKYRSSPPPDWMRSGPWPSWVLRCAFFHHLVENLLMMVRPSAGEELLLIAKK